MSKKFKKEIIEKQEKNKIFQKYDSSHVFEEFCTINNHWYEQLASKETTSVDPYYRHLLGKMSNRPNYLMLWDRKIKMYISCLHVGKDGIIKLKTNQFNTSKWWCKEAEKNIKLPLTFFISDTSNFNFDNPNKLISRVSFELMEAITLGVESQKFDENSKNKYWQLPVELFTWTDLHGVEINRF